MPLSEEKRLKIREILMKLPPERREEVLRAGLAKARARNYREELAEKYGTPDAPDSTSPENPSEKSQPAKPK